MAEASSPAVAAAGRLLTRSSARGIAVWTAFGVVGAALVWSRFASLHQSLWADEITTARDFVSPGPAAIFGRYTPNDHMLFSLLGWLTVRLPGLDLTYMRLWSIVPFIGGVVLVTRWLARRHGVGSALAFAFLATASEQLLMLSAEGRGYGLAFFAGAWMTVVAADAATAEAPPSSLSAFAVAGTIGALTLPTFVLPFAGASLVLARERRLRSLLWWRIALAGLAIGAWYAAPAHDLLASTDQHFGSKLSWYSPLTGPPVELARAFVPLLSTSWSIVLAAPVLIAGLFVVRRSLPYAFALLVVPVELTFVGLTIGRFFVELRFVSYLLVPILIVAALGLQDLLTPRHGLRSLASTAFAVLLVLPITIVFLTFGERHARWPPEANRDAANAVAAALDRDPRPLVINATDPRDLLYYLPRHPSLVTLPPMTMERAICSERFGASGLVFVQQPYGVPVLDTSCLRRRGGVRTVFRQWDRGMQIVVWAVPRSRS